MVLLVFVSSLMTACIMTFQKSDIPSEDVLPVIATADTAEDTQRHVFHSGALKGVWIPYFAVSDGEPLGEYEFMRRYDELLDTVAANGINAVFVHVRAHCDAAYMSEIFPPMDIYKMHETIREYDPLKYMVEAAHNRGIEFHAWINPYRIDTLDEAKNNIAVTQYLSSSDIIEYDGMAYIDPESERGRKLITEGAAEIAQNYDVDGIHMDDYFYPYVEDDAENTEDCGESLTLRQWRCENVNRLVKELYDTVKSIDSEMLFGVSPQGNYENDLEIGADVCAWCEGGYVDYIAPQIYFNSENPVCPFEETANFWCDMAHTTGVKIYPGLALYKVGTDADGGTWYSDGIIESQEKYLQNKSDGVILYSVEELY